MFSRRTLSLTNGRTFARALILLAATLAVSCQDNTRPLLAEFDTPTGPPKNLRETFDFLRTASEHKSYLALRPYVEPVLRDEVIDFLLAVDALRIANATVLKTVEHACPDLPRERLDLSVLDDTLEIFSRQVEVQSQREDRQKGEAVVSILIAGRPPPADVHFRLCDGRWIYVPGPRLEESTQAFRALADSLERVHRALIYSDHVTPQHVQDEYQLFVAPTIKRMAETLSAR